MKRPALVGIVNVTPDSFSGDGRLADAAVSHAKALAHAGADILDIGAESTRPNAIPLTPEEEWVRLEQVLEGILVSDWRPKVRLSIDTRHAQTAAHALAMEIDIINDVGGLTDPVMAKLLEDHSCDIVVMHALGLPADPKRTLAADCDVVAEILRWKDEIAARTASYGIAAERLIYDAGIGFGKTPQQSLALIMAAEQLKQSGGRWLMGHSRKSFLKLFTSAEAEGRDDLTLAFSAQLAEAGMDYLRVHNVARHTAMFEQLCM